MVLLSLINREAIVIGQELIKVIGYWSGINRGHCSVINEVRSLLSN